MSGAAGDTGFDYQADVFASVATSLLTVTPLHWFDDFDDTPVAISLESDGPGDDLRIETPDGIVEVQAKHGLRRDRRYAETICRLFSGLLRDENLRAVLFVDGTASSPIRHDVHDDIQKLAGGRSDSLRPSTTALVQLLEAKGHECDASVFARFRIIVGDLDDGSTDMRTCVRQLEGILPNLEDARICWDELGKEGHRLTRNRGRRDRASLLRMLRHKLNFAVQSTDLVSAPEYFSSYSETGRIFHHRSKLVGRQTHLSELKKFETDGNQLGLLIGRGGIGKSKLIYEFTKNCESSVWCLQTESTIEQAALRLIPKARSIIVIEDGHRLPGLKPIIRVIHSMRPEAKILLTARAHSKEHVVSTVVDAGIDVSKISRFEELKELSRGEVEELCTDFFPNDLELAATLARATWDCPLVTVVAAELIRRDDLSPSLLANDQQFRDAVLSKLKEQLLSGTEANLDGNSRQALLNLLAALAPVDVSNAPLMEKMAKYLSVSLPDFKREIGDLTESGILICRDSHVRITPDVLSDHLLNTACCDYSGRSTGYADEVFACFGQSHAAVILSNLAELDWRLRSSETNAPCLLSEIIDRLEVQFNNSNLSAKTELLDVLTEAAYFIPERILPMLQAYVESCESVGAFSLTNRTIEVAAACLKRTSYTLRTVGKSLDLLWRLRKVEPQQSNQRPKVGCHKIIKDIARYEFRKPYEYTTASVAALVKNVNVTADKDRDTEIAFEVIDEVLTKGPSNIYHHNNRFVTSAFVVQFSRTQVPRNTAIDLLFSGLRGGELKRKLRCIKSLANALRKPLATMGVDLTKEDRDQWLPEQLRIVQGLSEFLPEAEPLVVTQIIEAVSWHIFYEERGQLVTAARDAARRVADSLELRFLRCVLSDVDVNWGCDFVDAPIPVDHRAEVQRESEQQFAKSVAAEFLACFPVATAGSSFLHGQLATCQAGEVRVNMHNFLWSVADLSHNYAAELAELIIDRSDEAFGFVEAIRSLTEPVARRDRTIGIRQLKRLADAGSAWRTEAARTLAYSDWFDSERNESTAILRDLMTDTTPETVQAVAAAIRRLSRSDLTMGITLALEYTPPVERKIADEYAGIFCGEYGIPVADLSPAQIDRVLDKLVLMTEVEEWHVGQFLNEIAKLDYSRLVSFFVHRIEHEQQCEGRYDSVPHREYSSVRLDPPSEQQCRKAGLTIIAQASDADHRLQYRFGQLLRLLCGSNSKSVLSELTKLLKSGESVTHELAVRLISQLGSEFLVDQSDLVCLAIKEAETLGSDVLSTTSGAFHSQALNRIRVGTAGEPFPQDLHLLNGCTTVLERQDISSAARTLFEKIKANIQVEMKRDGWDDEFPL